MKSKYSEDFPEDFDKTPSNDPSDSTDMALVNFLKQNKPITPAAAPNFEQQLFAEISKYPQQLPHKNFKRWLPWILILPVALITGLGFNMANNRSLQVATNSMSEAEKSAIEQSLISSWDATETTFTQTASTTATATDNQILMELSPLEYE